MIFPYGSSCVNMHPPASSFILSRQQVNAPSPATTECQASSCTPVTRTSYRHRISVLPLVKTSYQANKHKANILQILKPIIRPTLAHHASMLPVIRLSQLYSTQQINNNVMLVCSMQLGIILTLDPKTADGMLNYKDTTCTNYWIF